MATESVTLLTLLLAILGALAGPRLAFQLLFPHIYPVLYDYDVRSGITYDGPAEGSEAQEYPWEMVDPFQDANDMVWVQNDGEHPLEFEVEFEIDEQWTLNLGVRIEDVFEETVPGRGLSLIAREFVLGPGGSRSFTFPYIPHSERCQLTVTVVPTLDPARLGLPRYLAQFLGEVTLKEEKRYFVVTADEETIDQWTPSPF